MTDELDRSPVVQVQVQNLDAATVAAVAHGDETPDPDDRLTSLRISGPDVTVVLLDDAGALWGLLARMSEAAARPLEPRHDSTNCGSSTEH